MAAVKNIQVHIIFTVFHDHVEFTTGIDDPFGSRTGSNPIFPGENSDITKGRILQSLGLFTPDYYTSEDL